MNDKKKDYYLYTMTCWKPHTRKNGTYKEFITEGLELIRKTGLRSGTFLLKDWGIEANMKVGWNAVESDMFYQIVLVTSLPNYMAKFKRLAVDKLAIYLMKKLEGKNNG